VLLPPVLFVACVHGVLSGLIEARPFELREDETAGIILPMSMIQQVVVSEGVVYLRSVRDRVVGMIDGDGRALGTIGTPGTGPGEIDGGILAMAVDRKEVYLITTGHRDRVLHFSNGVFERTIPVTVNGMSMLTLSSANGFSAMGNRFVLPAPLEGPLAYLYNGESKTALGVPLFDKDSEPELMRALPVINDTLWAREGETWYGLFKYYPAITTLRSGKQEVTSLDLPSALEAFDALVSPSRTENRVRTRRPRQLFADFSVINGEATILSEGTLYRVSPKTGDIAGLARFTVDLPELDGAPYTFHCFAQLEDGRILFGNFNPNLETLLFVAENPF